LNYRSINANLITVHCPVIQLVQVITFYPQLTTKLSVSGIRGIRAFSNGRFGTAFPFSSAIPDSPKQPRFWTHTRDFPCLQLNTIGSRFSFLQTFKISAFYLLPLSWHCATNRKVAG